MPSLNYSQMLLVVTFVSLAILVTPSAFATNHQEQFPTFYRNMTIFKGDTITVTNPTQVQYQVDGDGFGSGTINPNGTAVTFTFNKLGSFAIFDEWHRNLTGFINVVDPTLTPIIITIPSPITVQSTSSSGTAVTYSVTAVDAVDGSITPVCTPTSGSNFVVGTTTVTCTAKDAAGNIGTTTFTVTVQKQAPLDTTPPIVTPPSNQVVISTNSNGMVVNYPNATATDNVGVNSGPTCNPASGSTFPIGTTTVTCTASDAAGNVGQVTFTVKVQSQTTTPYATMVTSTDKSSYNLGDTIITNGHVNNPDSSTLVTQRIFNSNNNLISVWQLLPTSDGSFTKTLQATGPLWINAGTYTIISQYGLITNTTTSFYLNSGNISPPTSNNQISIIQGSGASASVACISTNNCFSPSVLNVAPGTDVIWNNNDNISHTVTSGKVSDDNAGSLFDSGLIRAGGTFEYTFRNSGTYDYHDTVHPWMTGHVIVGNSIPPISTTSTITVTTDKSSYTIGDPIKISGTISEQLDVPISVVIKDPSQLIVFIGQTNPNSDNTYSTQITTDRNLWKTSGTYEIDVAYGGKDRTSKTTFQFSIQFTPSLDELLKQRMDDANRLQELLHKNTTTNIPSPQSTSIITPTQQNIDAINQAKANQTIAAEVNVSTNQSTTTSIDSNVTVQTITNNPNSLGVTVSASSQTGPKVIAFNLNATTINVANLKDLGVMYDGKLIQPAPNMDAILHAKPTDSPSFAIVVTQSGIQVLVLVPHFSTHSITITNMSKVIPAIPEFGPIVGMMIIISLIGVVAISKLSRTSSIMMEIK